MQLFTHITDYFSAQISMTIIPQLRSVILNILKILNVHKLLPRQVQTIYISVNSTEETAITILSQFKEIIAF